MKPIVAIVAQGSMGTGLAHQLTQHGVTVLTDLSGRSEASHARALAAGMTPTSRAGLMDADILMSVLPPAQALPFAIDLAPTLRRAVRKPLFVDCNAVSPAKVQSICEALEPTGAGFVDVGIIGLPPQAGVANPRLYAAGQSAGTFKALSGYGLDVRVLEGPVGTASGLKMAYAGVTKGLIFVSSAMLLAAWRAGVAPSLAAELASSEAALFGSLSRRIPDMLPKAYRWVAEMEEIADFVGADPSASTLYGAAARFYERIADGLTNDGGEAGLLQSFFALADGAGDSDR